MKRLLVALLMVMLFVVGVRAQDDNTVTVRATQFMVRQLMHDSTDVMSDTSVVKFVKPWSVIDSGMAIDITRRPYGRFFTFHNRNESQFHTALRPYTTDSTNWANYAKGFIAIDEEGLACTLWLGVFMDGRKDYRGDSNYYYIKIVYSDIVICYIYEPPPYSPSMDR